MKTIYKNLVLTVLLLSLSSSALSKTWTDTGYNCFHYEKDGNGWYNLDMVKRSDPFKVENVTSHLGDNSTVYFNACHSIKVDGCTNTGNAVAIVKRGEECAPLSIWSEDKKNGRSAWSFEVTNPVNSLAAAFKSMASVRKLLTSRHVDAALESLEKINLESAKDFGSSKGINIIANNTNSTTITQNLTINAVCNKDVKEPTKISATYAAGLYTLSFEDNNACSFDAFSFWKKLGWGQYIVEGVIALFALVLCVAGIRIEKPALFSIGFFAGAAISYVFLSLFVENAVGKDWWFWVIIGVAVVIGIICGFLLFWLRKIGVAAAGAFLGYVLGNFLYTLVVYKLDGEGTPVWYYVTLVGCALICGILAFWLTDIIFILATSFGGAYISVRMVGTMLDKYPDESFIAQQIASGEIDNVSWTVYLFLGIMVALAILGLIVQCKAKKQLDDEKKHKERDETYNKGGAYTRVDY